MIPYPQGERVDPVGATLTDEGAEHLPATDPNSLVGTDLAHFHIEALLGKGGMGEVYKATDTALDRPVAIKVLPPAIAEDNTLRSRFFREARAQARLHHPNVCHIYYIGEQGDRLFFAMEYIDGESLAARLQRQGKLAPDEAVELCRMSALGIALALSVIMIPAEGALAAWMTPHKRALWDRVSHTRVRYRQTRTD